jgi:hypothetical protein
MLATRMSPPKPILPVPATLTRAPGPVARLALIVEPVTVTLVVWSTPIAPPPAVPVAELDVIVGPEMSRPRRTSVRFPCIYALSSL